MMSLMAAVGMGGRRLSRGFYRPALGKREARTLEAVRIAVAMGVELNAADTFGRTALDAAKELGYHSVVAYLAESGADVAD